MNKQWQRLAVRVDAMQLRERVFLFLAILIGCLAIADTLWLSPAQSANMQAAQRFKAQGADLQRMREELKTLAQPVDPSKAVRDEVAAANLRLDAINNEIKAVAPQAQGGPAIEQTLVQFLRRQDGLTLLRTGTIKQEALGTTGTAGAPAMAASDITRRGLELSVSGSYAELTRYVQTLENALPTLRWGPLELTSTKAIPEMNLQVYVVGVPP